MTTRSLPTAAALLAACLQAGPLLAQSTPAPTSAASPAPAATPAPASSPAAAAPPAPRATASADKNSANEGKATPGTEPAKPKSPKRIKISAETQHEIAHSLKTGTVPSRYRSKVPKEYQKYIPFER